MLGFWRHPLFDELSRMKSDVDIDRLIGIQRMAAALGDQVPVITSVRQLREVHADLMPRMQGLSAPTETLPPPPFPAASNVGLARATIRPITTASDLLAHGTRMKHCAGAYATSVADGACYLYAVETRDGEFTAELEPCGKTWRLGQLAGLGNRPAPQLLRNSLESWLEALQEFDNPEDLHEE